MKKQNVAKAPSEALVPKTRGKSRNKNHKPEAEQLRDELRTLKTIVKHLKKQLAQYQKDEQRLEDLQGIAQEALLEQEHNNQKCSACGKGNINLVELGPKSMLKCNVCEYWRLLK